jgi:uncharacterized protein (TIGR02147 family)
MNHGILSMVLRNKRPLTPQLIQKMGLSLKLSKKELDSFVASEAGKTARIKKINQMTVDVFNVVSDWYHDAILELSRIRGFKPAPEFVSKRLGITVSEARAAIERLQRVGLVEVMSDGSWVETLGDNTTVIDIDHTSSALRNLQKQVLQLSAAALENVPRVSRDHSCMTMAIDEKDLQEAKRRIQSCRHELMTYLQRNGTDFTEVYQLAVSLYPLTQIKKRKEK